MDFSEKVKDLAKRSKHASKNALTEEATKTSVVLPLLQALGLADIYTHAGQIEATLKQYV